MTATNGTNGSAKVGTSTVKQGLAQMLKGGVIVSFFVDSMAMIERSVTWKVFSHSIGLGFGFLFCDKSPQLCLLCFLLCLIV